MNIKFTDVLKTMLGYLRIDSLLQYKQTYNPDTDYVDETIPSWINVKNYVDGNTSSVIYGLIPAGTTIPKVVSYSQSLNPTVSIVVPLSTDGTNKMLTSRQITAQYDLTFSNSAKDTLVSVNIYGNDDGTGHFNEDTYYRIQG